MASRHDVCFVVLDSARTDRVSAYGHDRETTPTLDALSEEATVYENAFVPAPWTLPSHCSMFTGRAPAEHGVTNGFADRSLGLPEELPTIAERFRERGYRTAGFSNNPWVGELSGLDRGFDLFVEWDLEISRSAESVTHRSRDELYSRAHSLLGRAAGQPHVLLKRRFFTSNLVERATRWLAGPAADAPAFTFMNLMEAHSPYYPPKNAFRELGLDPPNALESRLLNTRLLAYVMGKTDLEPAQRERVLEFYDASLRYQDRKLDELLRSLRAEGRYDDTLLVICADHGKTLGEHDRDATPPHYVRDINTNVPLLVKWPGQTRGERVAEPIELADLHDLLRSDERRPFTRRDALVEDYVPHTGRDSTDVERWRALADGSRKYVRSAAGDEYLFDREDDELVADPSGQLRRYRERLRERVDELGTPADAADEAAEEGFGAAVEGQLEDLGYL